MAQIIEHPEFLRCKRRQYERRLFELCAEMEASERFDDIRTKEDIARLREEDPFRYAKFMAAMVTEAV